MIKNKDKPWKAIKRLGTIFDFFPTLWYDRMLNNTIKLVEASSSYSLVRHLLYGNVDGINIDNNVINYNLKLLQEDEGVIELNKHINHARYAYYFSTI
ncbi:MAG: polar amino acid transport system substrate-binding protein [Psychroserpens sp.]